MSRKSLYISLVKNKGMARIPTFLLILILCTSFGFAVISGSLGGGLAETDPVWSADKSSYFNKTETNSTGLIGLECDDGYILEFNSGLGVWECAIDSTGTDDQTLAEVLAEGNDANSLGITNIEYLDNGGDGIAINDNLNVLGLNKLNVTFDGGLEYAQTSISPFQMKQNYYFFGTDQGQSLLNYDSLNFGDSSDSDKYGTISADTSNLFILSQPDTQLGMRFGAKYDYGGDSLINNIVMDSDSLDFGIDSDNDGDADINFGYATTSSTFVDAVLNLDLKNRVLTHDGNATINDNLEVGGYVDAEGYGTFKGYISSEGTTYGSEKITNGGFTTVTTPWELGTGWSYFPSIKVQKDSDGTGTLYQSPGNMTSAPVIGETYRVSYETILFTAGSVTPSFAGVTLTTRNTTGTFTENIVANTTEGISFLPTLTSRFQIDDVSITKVNAGDLYVSNDAFIDTTTISSGSITDSTGEIDFDDENIRTTGNITSTNETFGIQNNGNCIIIGDLTLGTTC